MALSQSSSRCPHDSANHRSISTSLTSEPSNQTCECESVRLGDFFSSEYDLSDLPCPEDINHGSLPEEISSQPSSLPPSSPSAAGADSERANLVFNITVQNNLVNKFCTRFLQIIPSLSLPQQLPMWLQARLSHTALLSGLGWHDNCVYTDFTMEQPQLETMITSETAAVLISSQVTMLHSGLNKVIRVPNVKTVKF